MFVFKIRRAAGVSSQNTTASVNILLKQQNEQVVFHEKWPDLLQHTLKIVIFDEPLIVRESICNNFRHASSGLDWGGI